MLVRLRVTVAPRLFLVGGGGVDGRDVAVIALVLRAQHLVLVAEVAGLLAQPVPEVSLLRVRDRGPHRRAQNDPEDDRAPRDCKGGWWDAGRGERDGALSHAGSLAVTFGVRAGADYSKRFPVCRLSAPRPTVSPAPPRRGRGTTCPHRPAETPSPRTVF